MRDRRIIIYGNSGSGKTTMASRLAAEHGMPVLDLDTITWAPECPGVRLPAERTAALLRGFVQAHRQWVIEGCYGDVIEMALLDCTELRFLNPGVEQCAANTLKRPWRAHKYPSIEDKEKDLAFITDWVKQYETRTDEFSLSRHRAIFESFGGDKREYGTQVEQT